MSILEISKTLIYEFWYDYIKPKYQNDAKLSYKDTDSFIIHNKTEDLYKYIADAVDASHYKVDIPLPKGKNEKKIELMKDKLGGKIMIEFVALRPKTYYYLMNDGRSDKKAKRTKKLYNRKNVNV